MDWTTLLFGFKGRINRAKFWLACLIYTIVMVALLAFIILTLGDIDKDRIGDIIGAGLLFVAVGAVVFVVLLWSSCATAIKRLHDRGKSAWWVLLFWILPGLIGAVADNTTGSVSLALNVVSIALSVWGFVEVGCLRGTQGPNEFGPDPLGAPELAPGTA